MWLGWPFTSRRWPVEAYLLLISLAVALPLAAALAYSVVRDHESDREHAEDSLQAMSATAAANTARFIRDAEASLAVLVERPLVRAADPARCDPFLADFLASNPAYLNVAVTNAAGEIVCSGRPLPPGPPASAAGLGWWEAGMAGGKPFVSEPHEGPVTGQLVAVIGHPFTVPTGAPAGLVGVSIDLVRFQEHIEGMALPAGGTVIILDGAGTVVARSVDPETWVGKNVRNSGIGEAGLTETGGIIEARGADGVERVYAYTAIPGTDWRAYVGLTTEYVYGDSNAALRRNLAIALATIAVALVLGFVASRNLQRPVRRLAGAAPGVVAGEPGFRAPVGGPEEIASVGAGLNLLAGMREEALVHAAGLGAIVEATDAAVLAVTPAGAITLWNEGAEGLFGYTAEEMLGRDIVKLAPERHRAEAEELLRRTAAGDRAAAELGTALSSDGREMPVSLSAFPILDAAGNVVALGAVMRDISAHMAAVREAARLGAIVETSDDAIISRTTGGHILTWNAAAERLFGYTAEEVAGQDIHFMVPEDQRVEMDEIIARTARGEVVRTETVRLAKDGRRIEVAATLFPIGGRGAEGIVGAILRDIGERKRLERERAEAANAALRLAEVVKSANDAVVVGDMEGMVTFVNPAVERMLGYSAADVIGRSPFIFVPEDEQARAASLLAEAVAGEPLNIEIEVLAKDGRRVPVSVSIFPVRDEAGTQTGIANIARDLTEEKRMEREREEAARVSAQLAAIVEWSDDAVMSRDLEGRVLSWNAASERLFGWTAEEMLGQGMERLVPPELREEAVSFVVRARAGEVVRAETERLTKDGRRIATAFSLFPVLGAEGAPVALAAVVRDISERRRLEREHAEATRGVAELAAIVESSDEAIIGRTREGQVLTWNAGAERLFGYSAEEMVGAGIERLFPPELRDEAIELVARAWRGETARVETERLAKDGRRVPVMLSLSRVLGQDGEPFAVAGIMHDISDRKAAEAALREGEERYRLLIDRSPYGIAVHQDEKIVFVNAAGARILGVSSPDELAGKPISEIIHPDYWDEARERMAHTFAGDRGSNPSESLYVRADGTPVPVEVIAAPFVYDGRPAVQVIVADITERKKAEEEQRQLEAQLQHTQKLESLGVLAGGIAHDFNNLLLGILGNAGLAMEELPPASPARETVRDIEAAAIRAAELTRQLLAYAGRARFTVEPVDVSTLVGEMAHLLEVSVSKKARLAYQFAQGLPAIEGDATQLRQVVMNLITNASDAIGDNPGTITVTTGLMEATREDMRRSYVDGDLPPGRYIYVEVEDTGVGMDQATMDRIFEPFFTTKFTGRGLGMASVLGIVRAHRGAIVVESEPGKGSTLRVLFPATAATPKAAAKPTAPAEARLEGRTALVVDDDEVVRKLTVRVLERAGAKVEAAANGREAVSTFRARGGAFDFVVLDLTMPEMDGAETFGELLELDPGVLVILSSGFGEEEAFERFDSAGVAAFIQKPYTPAELVEVVQRVLAN